MYIINNTNILLRIVFVLIDELWLWYIF